MELPCGTPEIETASGARRWDGHLQNVRRYLGIPFLPETAGLLFPLMFYIFITVILLSRILKDNKVTSDTLYGAACIY